MEQKDQANHCLIMVKAKFSRRKRPDDQTIAPQP
jgi:hypothetical protein